MSKQVLIFNTNIDMALKVWHKVNLELRWQLMNDNKSPPTWYNIIEMVTDRIIDNSRGKK